MIFLLWLGQTLLAYIHFEELPQFYYSTNKIHLILWESRTIFTIRLLKSHATYPRILILQFIDFFILHCKHTPCALMDY